MKSERRLVHANKDLHSPVFSEILADLTKKKYEVVRFINCNLRDTEVEQLAETIKQHSIAKNLRNLKYLDLRENHISEAGTQILLDAIKTHPKLRKVDFRFNSLVVEEEIKSSVKKEEMVVVKADISKAEEKLSKPEAKPVAISALSIFPNAKKIETQMNVKASTIEPTPQKKSVKPLASNKNTLWSKPKKKAESASTKKASFFSNLTDLIHENFIYKKIISRL